MFRYKVERTVIEVYEVDTNSLRGALTKIKQYAEGKKFTGKVALLSARRAETKIERAQPPLKLTK